MLTLKSCAKINLTIKILGNNKYGYTDIDSKFLFLEDIYDELVIDESHDFCGCEVIFLDKTITQQEIKDNSIDIMASCLGEYFGQAIKLPQVTLIKRLPVSSGIGAGSSNGACYAYNALRMNNVSAEDQIRFLKASCQKFGDDTTTFLYKYIHAKPWIRVIGSSFDLNFYDYDIDTYSGKTIFLINNKTTTCARDVYNIANRYGITMTEAGVKLNQSIAFVLDQLSTLNPFCYGMSGSGPTCFALFDNNRVHDARINIAEIAQQNEWWMAESNTLCTI